MTGEAEKIETEIKVLEQEIDELKKLICNYCCGEGEIIDKTRISVLSIDIPYCICPQCQGTGLNT